MSLDLSRHKPSTNYPDEAHAPWIINPLHKSHRLKMAPSQSALPTLLKRSRSLSSAIEDLSSTSAPFEDPFSADMAAFAKQFLVDGFEMQALPASFAGVSTFWNPTAHLLHPAPTLNATSSSAASQHSYVFPQLTCSARTSSEVSLTSTTRTGSLCDDCNAPGITHASLDASTSCWESDTEQQSDAFFEGTSSSPTGARSAPHPGWTTQEVSIFLETLTAINTSHSSSEHDARNVAQTVASVVATRSAQEVYQSRRCPAWLSALIARVQLPQEVQNQRKARRSFRTHQDP